MQKSLCKMCSFVQYCKKNHFLTLMARNIPLIHFSPVPSPLSSTVCLCGLLYVGRTIRMARANLGEQRIHLKVLMWNIACPDTSLLNTINQLKFSVWVIESIPPLPPLANDFNNYINVKNLGFSP